MSGLGKFITAIISAEIIPSVWAGVPFLKE
jgi:hypothetical protein